MSKPRDIHPNFLSLLMFKEKDLIELFIDLRNFVLDLYPDTNELLYHTHALTAVFSLSEKLGDAYCMLPIYTNHVNLCFNKGALLDDPRELLKAQEPSSGISRLRSPRTTEICMSRLL